VRQADGVAKLVHQRAVAVSAGREPLVGPVAVHRIVRVRREHVALEFPALLARIIGIGLRRIERVGEGDVRAAPVGFAESLRNEIIPQLDGGARRHLLFGGKRRQAEGGRKADGGVVIEAGQEGLVEESVGDDAVRRLERLARVELRGDALGSVQRKDRLVSVGARADIVIQVEVLRLVSDTKISFSRQGQRIGPPLRPAGQRAAFCKRGGKASLFVNPLSLQKIAELRGKL
jgi:hypothetical protein